MTRLVASSRGLVATLSVVALVASTVGIAHAQCAFDAPAKAKGIKSSFVRAYASCPGVTFPTSNTSTMAGVPGCAPPAPVSGYQFDPNGSCSFRLTQFTEEPCSSGRPGACTRLRVVGSCRGILDPDGTILTQDPDWAISLVTRVTFNAESNDDMTVLDFPWQLPFQLASPGVLEGRFDIGPCLDFECFESLPACIQFEILSVTIHDPDYNAFAKLGSSAR